MTSKLSPTEFRKVKEELRIYCKGMSPHVVANIAKLVHHAEALYTDNKDLQGKLSDINQLKISDLLIDPPPPYIPPVKEKWQGETLLSRITQMIVTNQTTSDQWKRLLRYNNLTHDKALSIYAEHKKKE